EIRIVVRVSIPMKLSHGIVISGYWINRQEPRDHRIVIALNTQTRRGFRFQLRSTLDAVRPATANALEAPLATRKNALMPFFTRRRAGQTLTNLRLKNLC